MEYASSAGDIVGIMTDGRLSPGKGNGDKAAGATANPRILEDALVKIVEGEYQDDTPGTPTSPFDQGDDPHSGGQEQPGAGEAHGNGKEDLSLDQANLPDTIGWQEMQDLPGDMIVEFGRMNMSDDRQIATKPAGGTSKGYSLAARSFSLESR